MLEKDYKKRIFEKDLAKTFNCNYSQILSLKYFVSACAVVKLNKFEKRFELSIFTSFAEIDCVNKPYLFALHVSNQLKVFFTIRIDHFIILLHHKSLI